MDQKKTFVVSTAIVYANASPHIGFALEQIYCDAMARAARLRGQRVTFMTGTDEHGQKIARKAEDAEKDPQTFTDEIAEEYRALAAKLSISYTDFIRTTEPRHRASVEAFWERVMNNGYIEKRTYRGLYCVGCEAFKTEKDLVDGKCPDHLVAPEMVEDENYFFLLSKFGDRLNALYAERPDFVYPEEKFNEVKQMVAGGLEDISISRSTKFLTWGIPVPGDASQVIYVWFDALVNYLTVLGFPDDSYADRWPASWHIVGKEINRFHTVLWPAMLMAAGIEVPSRVGVHGWIHVDGQKMSKTIGNVIAPQDLLETFGLDGMRYLLLRYIPFNGDGDYSDHRFRERYDSDLANNLGNLVFRVSNMLMKYRDGVVPAQASSVISIDDISARYQAAIASLSFDQALGIVWTELIDAANKLIEETKPWTLAKEGKESELNDVLYRCLETLRLIAWMIRPCMPGTSDALLDQLGQTSDRDSVTWSAVMHWGVLEPGSKVALGQPMFPRLATTEST